MHTNVQEAQGIPPPLNHNYTTQHDSAIIVHVPLIHVCSEVFLICSSSKIILAEPCKGCKQLY